MEDAELTAIVCAAVSATSSGKAWVAEANVAVMPPLSWMPLPENV